MRRTTRKLVFTALLTAGAIALTPAAYAGKARTSGKGGKPSGGSSSMSIQMVTDQNGDGQPNYADAIRFNVSTTATTEPHVSVSCTQNGSVVYTAQTGYYASYQWPSTQTFHLYSGAWTGGAASCNARLYSASNNGSTTTLSTMAFDAGA